MSPIAAGLKKIFASSALQKALDEPARISLAGSRIAASRTRI